MTLPREHLGAEDGRSAGNSAIEHQRTPEKLRPQEISVANSRIDANVSKMSLLSSLSAFLTPKWLQGDPPGRLSNDGNLLKDDFRKGMAPQPGFHGPGRRFLLHLMEVFPCYGSGLYPIPTPACPHLSSLL